MVMAVVVFCFVVEVCSDGVGDSDCGALVVVVVVLLLWQCLLVHNPVYAFRRPPQRP